MANYDPDAPVPGGIPDPIPQIDTLVEVVQDATWWALGNPPCYRIFISTQGDWWDTIAMKAYGRTRGNENLMHRLIEANYELRELSCFPAGMSVMVPVVDVATTIPLVPWKNASSNPSPS